MSSCGRCGTPQSHDDLCPNCIGDLEAFLPEGEYRTSRTLGPIAQTCQELLETAKLMTDWEVEFCRSLVARNPARLSMKQDIALNKAIARVQNKLEKLHERSSSPT